MTLNYFLLDNYLVCYKQTSLTRGLLADRQCCVAVENFHDSFYPLFIMKGDPRML